MKLFFRKLGEKGSPIVILHGIFGTSDNWVGIAKILSENHQVFLLDLRNHGHSPWSDQFDYQVMSEDLLEFIQDHSLDKPLLIGHSLGGKVVMQFELNHPNISSKIVIVDIAPKFYPVHHSLILEGLNSLDVANLESRQAANEHMKRFEESEGVRLFLLKNLHRNAENGFEWKINLKVITKNIDVVGLKLWLNQPSETKAIFIKGADSHYIQPEDQQLISEIFPNFELFEIPHAGHWVQADQPVAFMKVLNTLL